MSLLLTFWLWRSSAGNINYIDWIKLTLPPDLIVGIDNEEYKFKILDSKIALVSENNIIIKTNNSLIVKI